MINVVSFCLWGTNPHYLNGAESALESVHTLYPDWESWIYIAEDVPNESIARLTEKASRVIRMTRGHGRKLRNSATTQFQFEPAFWRFLPASDPSVSKLLVRDSDSPVTPREVAAVNEWLASGKGFHIMRDHPKHEYPILAGLWGTDTALLRDIDQLIRKWNRFDYYGCDQTFLAKIIYPHVRKHAYIHSECIMFPHEVIHHFPTPRQDSDFIGISHTGDESRLALQIRYLNEWIGAGSPVYLRPLPWSLKGLVRIYSRGRFMSGRALPPSAHWDP